ncbi:MAG: chromosome segregation protein ScpA [archaeon]|nr:chromosome segregation protein ScpA [archaeon]
METTNEILKQHLLFHKALIDDNIEIERINKYLRILSEEPDCERMQDPVDESIRTIFRLVLKENFDPWFIDLREFVKIYSEKIISTTSTNIIVAGKLILMAWKILKMQTEATRQKFDTNKSDESICLFEEPELECDSTLYVPNISLKETYARTPQRPVTMMELLDAFDEARLDIIAADEREKVRQQLMKTKKSNIFDNKAHTEISENDVETVWQKIQGVGNSTFSLSNLLLPNIDDNITVFLSVLQLVRDGKLLIWQNKLPYDDIMIKVNIDALDEIKEVKVPTKILEAAV